MSLPADRSGGRRRGYLPLFHRVAAVNAVLLIAAVVVTILVLAPVKVSSVFVDGEGLVLLAALAQVILINLYLLRRVVGPVQALTALARRVDLANPGSGYRAAHRPRRWGNSPLTFNEMLSSGVRRPEECSPRRRPSGCGSPESCTTRLARR
jgi:hypothetical protein